MAGQRIKTILAVTASMLLLAGCADKLQAGAGGSSAAAPPVAVLASADPQVISNGRLIAPATYSDEPTLFAPPPASAAIAMTPAQAAALYAKGSDKSPAPLGKFDYALAQLTTAAFPGSKAGELVWLIINHDQHMPLTGPSEAADEMKALQAASQDSVTVIDAATGQWIVGLMTGTFHAASLNPPTSPSGQVAAK